MSLRLSYLLLLLLMLLLVLLTLGLGWPLRDLKPGQIQRR